MRTYSKRTGRWSAGPVKAAKTYMYISQLQLTITQACIDDMQPLARKKVLAPSDPRTIRPTIAATLPEATSVLVAKKGHVLDENRKTVTLY